MSVIENPLKNIGLENLDGVCKGDVKDDHSQVLKLLGYCPISAETPLIEIDNLTKELGIKKIRVNAICPGWVDTPFIRKQEANGRDLSPIIEMTPLGRLAEPREISNVVMFLLSDASSAVTGSALVVDCGITLAGGYMPYGRLPE